MLLFVLNSARVAQSWFVDVLGIHMLVSIALVVVLINWCASKERAERRAGYTTLRRGDKMLFQKDPYMGRIIRLAGADLIDRQRFSEILDNAKNEASKRKPF